MTQHIVYSECYSLAGSKGIPSQSTIAKTDVKWASGGQLG